MGEGDLEWLPACHLPATWALGQLAGPGGTMASVTWGILHMPHLTLLREAALHTHTGAAPADPQLPSSHRLGLGFQPPEW